MLPNGEQTLSKCLCLHPLLAAFHDLSATLVVRASMISCASCGEVQSVDFGQRSRRHPETSREHPGAPAARTRGDAASWRATRVGHRCHRLRRPWFSFCWNNNQHGGGSESRRPESHARRATRLQSRARDERVAPGGGPKLIGHRDLRGTVTAQYRLSTVSGTPRRHPRRRPSCPLHTTTMSLEKRAPDEQRVPEESLPLLGKPVPSKTTLRRYLWVRNQ